MARARDTRPEWVVELDVEAVAIITVQADSHAEACAVAEEKVRALHVTELLETTGVRVVRVGEVPPNVLSAAEARGAETPSTGTRDDAES